jgi:hypothetical protein
MTNKSEQETRASATRLNRPCSGLHRLRPRRIAQHFTLYRRSSIETTAYTVNDAIAATRAVLVEFDLVVVCGCVVRIELVVVVKQKC